MGKTIIEKIISNHTKQKVSRGEIVWMDIDVRTARDFGGANVVKHIENDFLNNHYLDNPAKIFFTFDCNAPATTTDYATNQQRCRHFATKYGIKVYDVNRGIGSHVLIEEGLALPGNTVAGTDSHLNIVGAVGSFGQGMGDRDIAFIFKYGKTWLEVPPTMKIIIFGNIEYPLTAKDLTLAILKELGSSGALGSVIEFYGEVISRLDLAGRITLASMATEMGAVASIIPPDEKIINYCKKRAKEEFNLVTADFDAEYIETKEIKLENLTPLISAPPSPANVYPVEELEGIKVDSVFIGSCTNGRIEDYRDLANLIRKRKVHPRVMAKIVPATQKVYEEMLKEGLLAQLFEAGFIISNPGCGGCASGQIGITGEGEVQVSTSNRNFPGKQGKGETYLASPVVAAAAAVAGEIISPFKLL